MLLKISKALDIILRLINKKMQNDWNLRSELIIAISLLILSLAIFAAYQGVLFSSVNGSFNTRLTFMAVAIFPLFCALRVIWLYKIALHRYFGLITGSIDILLLSSIIYMFSQQYDTVAATLKSPSFSFYFVFIAIHAIRFKPIYILVNGGLSILAWSAITLILSKNDAVITHNYLEYVTSNAVLIGAEVEKLFTIALFTLALTIGAARTNSLHKREILSSSRLDEEKRLSNLKSDFLDTMSHELRTPMNGVLGMIQTLRLTQLSEKQSNMLQIMERSGDDLVRLLNDILEFSQMSLGELELNTHPFALKPLIDKIESKTHAAANRKGLKLLVEVHPRIPLNLIGDEARIQSVLENLLDNAVKFTTEGFVRLCVHGVEKDGRATIGFEVHDTGIGIDSDRQQDIFDAFQQVDGSKTRAYGGTGIGLALVQRIVDAMGSEIKVKSVKGHGSTFYFTISLPVDTQAVAPTITPEPVAPNIVNNSAPKTHTQAAPKAITRAAPQAAPLVLTEPVKNKALPTAQPPSPLSEEDELETLLQELGVLKKSRANR